MNVSPRYSLIHPTFAPAPWHIYVCILFVCNQDCPHQCVLFCSTCPVSCHAFMSWPVVSYPDLLWTVRLHDELSKSIMSCWNLSWVVVTYLELLWPIMSCCCDHSQAVMCIYVTGCPKQMRINVEDCVCQSSMNSIRTYVHIWTLVVIAALQVLVISHLQCELVYVQ